MKIFIVWDMILHFRMTHMACVCVYLKTQDKNPCLRALRYGADRTRKRCEMQAIRRKKDSGDHVIPCLVSELGKNRKNIGSLS